MSWLLSDLTLQKTPPLAFQLRTAQHVFNPIRLSRCQPTADTVTVLNLDQVMGHDKPLFSGNIHILQHGWCLVVLETFALHVLQT